jgi:FkbM family methyltransferase
MDGLWRVQAARRRSGAGDMERAERAALVQRLDRSVGIHRASWARQLTTTPYQSVRRVLLARRALSDLSRGRSRVVTRESFFGRPVELPVPACWDLQVYGTYIDEAELRLQKFMMRYLPEGGTYIDVGANIGFHCLLAVHVTGPTGRLHAFEPGREALGFLRRNLRGIDTVSIVEMAVTDGPGEVTFYEGLGAAMVSSSVVREHVATRSDTMREVTVPATSLDACTAEHGLAPDLVKIDVEGAELAVLEGASTLLAAGRAVVSLEMSHQEDEFAASHAPCIDLLAGHGYRSYRIDRDGHPHPVAGDLLASLHEECTVARGYVHALDNVLFLHPERTPSRPA